MGKSENFDASDGPKDREYSEVSVGRPENSDASDGPKDFENRDVSVGNSEEKESSGDSEKPGLVEKGELCG